jgi:hypothetical protein
VSCQGEESLTTAFPGAVWNPDRRPSSGGEVKEVRREASEWRLGFPRVACGGGDAGKQELDEVSAASGVREINVFLFRVG